MRRYAVEEAQAIEDMAIRFVKDKRIGTPVGGNPTFLQKNRDDIQYWLRNRNRGTGLKDYQLNQIAYVCQIYNLIRGLNDSYDECLIQRIRSYLRESHQLLDLINSNKRSFLSKRGIARTRAGVVLSGQEYFWHVHLDSTKDLIEKLGRINFGEPEESVWGTTNTELLNKLKDGSLDAGELTKLISEGIYLRARTFVDMGIRAT